METVETINLVDEYNKLKTENEQLREALADIANIVNPYEDGDTMQEIAREALKEKE
jgi:regulator of replication initiation timing